MLRSQSRLILVSFIVLLTLYLLTLNIRPSSVTLTAEDLSEPAALVIAVQFDLTERQQPSGSTSQSSDLHLLNDQYGANVAVYVWCGRRWFEYAHYLSVRSVLRHVRPDTVLFYYEHEPVLDYWLYNTWYKELRNDNAFFTTRPLEPGSTACGPNNRPNMDYVYRLLARPGGGLYVDERTVFDRYPDVLRNRTVVNGWNADIESGFIATKGVILDPTELKTAVEEQAIDLDTVCTDRTTFDVTSNTPICFHLDTSAKSMYPKDVWTRDSNIARSIRNTVYESSSVVTQRISREDLVPNIAHVVWLGGGPMDFLFYLCVLSLVYVAEVDVVYIHGDAHPTGQYWKSIRRLPQVKTIYRENPGTVFGTKVKVISHVTDIWRVDFMMKYGGIYIDTDAVFVQKLTKEMRSYDAMGSYDWTYWNAPFPDTINFGVMLGKKGAPYWKHFHESLRWFRDEDWAWNGLRQPYKIQERYPHLVRIEPHLQTICYLELCHPTWWEGYHDENQTHVNPMRKDRKFNWRKDTYAMHWTLPTPSELNSRADLLASTSEFADIGKFILQKAGLL